METLLRFALIDNVRSPARSGLAGTCPGCSEPVLSKCGSQRVWHWAHKGKRTCDTWWEPETEWHRNWKDNFPVDWLEIIHHDHLGERHIADVRTEHGLVVEFQHSQLDPAERQAREAFYGNIVWVVDGTRLSRDLPRFIKSRDDWMRTPLEGYLAQHFVEESFPKNWLESGKLVLFDFGPDPDMRLSADPAGKLWCLLPGRAANRAIFGSLPRDQFVKLALERPYILNSESIVAGLDQHYRDVRAMQAREAERGSFDRLARRKAYYRIARQRWRR